MLWFYLVVLCAVQSIAPLGIPEVFTVGNYYQIGYDVGYNFRAVIKDYYNQSKTLATVTQFIQTTEGKRYYNGYLDVVRKLFPHYLEELAGLAHGAGVTFTQAFSMMFSTEVRALLKLTGVQSCSDVYVNDKQVAIGHNEDGDPLIKDRGYIVHATVVNETGVIERFTAYTYPGSLPGNAFSFNGDGKVFTVNALYPVIVEANKIPRDFVNRALLGVKSQKQLEDLLYGLGVGVAYGFNVNYADTRNSSGLITDYEVTPIRGQPHNYVSKVTVGRKSDVRTQAEGHYYHFNMYEHSNVSQFPKDIVSSHHRKARAMSLPIPSDVLGVKTILGDTWDSKYPLYRTPRPTDPESTLATGIFLLDSCKLQLYKSNPRDAPRPIMTIPIPAGPMCGG